ncbi:MAG TPA: hypothetical protein VHM89_14090 [Acidimicrobiales bacterium]|nr:hypothetical protein [Acidimicrobiales bacterium]
MTVQRHAPSNGPLRRIHRLFPVRGQFTETAFSWLLADPVFAGVGDIRPGQTV